MVNELTDAHQYKEALFSRLGIVAWLDFTAGVPGYLSVSSSLSSINNSFRSANLKFISIIQDFLFTHFTSVKSLIIGSLKDHQRFSEPGYRKVVGSGGVSITGRGNRLGKNLNKNSLVISVTG